MLKLDKRKHLVNRHRRVGHPERRNSSGKGPGKLTLWVVKANKAKHQAAKAIELISNPNSIVEVTKAINHKVATKEPELKCSTGHKIVGLKHPSNLLDSRSLELQRQHESKGCHLHHPGSSYRAAYC